MIFPKKKPTEPKKKSAVPRTAQQTIPFQRMFEDGTCRVRSGYYTRTLQFQDINYQLALPEDRTAIKKMMPPLRMHHKNQSMLSIAMVI